MLLLHHTISSWKKIEATREADQQGNNFGRCIVFCGASLSPCENKKQRNICRPCDVWRRIHVIQSVVDSS